MKVNSKIFGAVIKYFKEDDWPFSQVEGEPVLTMLFQGDNGKWVCYARVREEQEQFIFYSEAPVKVPNNKRLAVAEFLTRVNYNLIIGNFEMDLEDGEVRYKTSIDLEGNDLNSALITPLVCANISAMDKYLPGIMSVIYTELSPTEALGQIEDS